jgi:hypothetical protein
MTTSIAFGDESGGHSNEDPGVFLLTACVLDSETVDAARASMEALRPAPNEKLHWRETSAKRDRRRIVDTVAALPSRFHVVVRVAVNDNPERRRAKALERLLLELEAIHVRQLVLESRTANQDRLDRNVLGGLRARKLVTTIRLDHVAGKLEPLVWVADVVCGVVADHRIGTPAPFYDDLCTKLVEHAVP